MPKRDTFAEGYYEATLQDTPHVFTRQRLASRLGERILLYRHLGLWDGKGSLPSSLPEAVLVQVRARVDELLGFAALKLQFWGVDGIDPWLPLLRFLASVVTGVTCPVQENYSKELRRSYKKAMADLLTASIPKLPRKERILPADFLETYIITSAKLLEIRRRTIARRRQSFRRKKAVTEPFPLNDHRMLFPELEESFLSELEVFHSDFALKRLRRMGESEIALLVLAHKYRCSDSKTVRGWLKQALLPYDVAVRWGHEDPLKDRIALKAKQFRP